LLCSLLLAVLAAHSSEAEADNLLAYTIKTFDYNQDGIAVQLKYPEISEFGKQYHSINEKIRKSILTIRFPGKTTDQTFADTKDFVKGVKRFIVRNDFKGYEFFSNGDVIYNARGIFTVKILNYEMPYGAANGLNSLIYLNLDAATGRRLGINDCFSDNGYKELIRRGKDYFIEKTKTDEVFDLLDEKFLSRFYLPVNFAVTDRGIEFAYQQYEVGPRPLGMPAFTIPHGEIKTLTDKDCALRRHLYQ
jgi:hypothetical protein